MPALAAFDDARLDADLANILHGVGRKAVSSQTSVVKACLQRLYASRRASATVAIALILAAFAGTALILEHAGRDGSDATDMAGPLRRPAALPDQSGTALPVVSRPLPSSLQPVAIPPARAVSVTVAPAEGGVATRPPRGHRTRPIAVPAANVVLADATPVGPPSPAEPSPGRVAAEDVASTLVPNVRRSDTSVDIKTVALPDRQVRRDNVDAIRAFRRQ